MPDNEKRLTPHMQQVLRDLGAGTGPRRPSGGRSASGGFQGTLHGLRQRGLITSCDEPPYTALTDAGRVALAQLQAKA